MRGHIEAKIQTHLSSAAMTGLFSLALLTVLREGAETVIFLTAAWSGIQSMGQSSGAVLGIVLAIIVGFALFQGMMKWFSIKWFFRLTSIFLFLFALHLAWEALEELIVG
jgi:high-affinity iron transporter